MSDFDETSARAVVTAMVLKRIKARHFAAFPALDRDYVIDEGVDAARKAWGSYDPRKSQPSTFIHRVASFRIIDLLRSENRRLERDTAFVHQKPGHVAPVELEDGEPVEDLVEWLSEIHRTIRRNMVRYGIPLRLTGRRGRPHTYDRAQAGALLALKRKKNLTCRGMVLLLQTRPELGNTISLPHLPNYSYFSRLQESVAQISFAPVRAA